MPVLDLPKRYYFLVLASTFALATEVTKAQEIERPKPDWQNTIETDGPDFTEASSVIPKGTFQVETGIAYTVDKVDGVESVSMAYPATLIRFGILPAMELRLIGEYINTKFSSPSPEFQGPGFARGIAPILIGTKLYICEEKGLRPQMSFIGHLGLPTGSSNFKPDYIAPEFRFSLSNTITDRIDVGYNVGYEWDGISPQGTAIYTLAIGYGLSKRWSTYLEVYGGKPEGEKMTHASAGGIKYLLAPNWQMDISGGHGITDSATDYYMAYGLRFRLPY